MKETEPKVAAVKRRQFDKPSSLGHGQASYVPYTFDEIRPVKDRRFAFEELAGQ
jgi:hypothetical protein